MWPNPMFPAVLITFTEEIVNRKLQFLCIDFFELDWKRQSATWRCNLRCKFISYIILKLPVPDIFTKCFYFLELGHDFEFEYGSHHLCAMKLYYTWRW